MKAISAKHFKGRMDSELKDLRQYARLHQQGSIYLRNAIKEAD